MQEPSEVHPQSSGLSPSAVYGYTTKTGRIVAGHGSLIMSYLLLTIRLPVGGEPRTWKTIGPSQCLGRLTTHSSFRGSGAKQLHKEAGNKSVFRSHSQLRLKHFPELSPYYLKTGTLGALVSESIRCSQRVQFSGIGCLPCRPESCSPRIQSPRERESRAVWEGEARCRQLRQATGGKEPAR